jgi:hypothetical protein
MENRDGKEMKVPWSENSLDTDGRFLDHSNHFKAHMLVTGEEKKKKSTTCI